MQEVAGYCEGDPNCRAFAYFSNTSTLPDNRSDIPYLSKTRILHVQMYAKLGQDLTAAGYLTPSAPSKSIYASMHVAQNHHAPMLRLNDEDKCMQSPASCFWPLDAST